MKKKGFRKILFLICFIFCAGISLGVYAQPGDPGGDPDVPISGIEWLLLGGGILGARKIYRKFNNRE